MNKVSRVRYPLFLVVTLFLCAISLWQPQWTNISLAAVLTPQQTPTIITEQPCGSGELLPSWAICLYGVVLQNGVPQSDVTVTVTRGEQSIQTTTFIHPGETVPTYALEISPLKPAYLQPVTLQATINDQTLVRQVTVFPDYRTHNQRFELELAAAGALETPSLWGYVVNFVDGTPVAGATVTVKYDGQQATTTTTPSATEPYPTYLFSAAQLAAIGASTGSDVEVIAEYDGDTAHQLVTLSADTPIQTNLVTGWQCDDTDPLPRDGGAFGLPRDGGAFGLPDLGCFWGYAIFNDEPVADAAVELTIGEDVYQGESKLFAGETIPRYAIAVPKGQSLIGQSYAVKGLYQGIRSELAAGVVSDMPHNQQVDLTLIDVNVSVLGDFDRVQALLWDDGYLWAGSDSGLVRWDPASAVHQDWTVDHGLVDNNIRSLAKDGAGNLWIGTTRGVSRLATQSNQWATFTTASGLVSNDIRSIVVDLAGAIWFGTDQGMNRYRPAQDQWDTFTTTNTGANGLISNEIQTIAVHPNNGDLWIGVNGGVNHYNPNTNTWEHAFTPVNSMLLNGDVEDIDIDAARNVIWMGVYDGGVSRYGINTGQWETFAEQTGNGPATDWVLSVAADADGNLWVGTLNNTGVSYFDINTEQWTTYYYPEPIPFIDFVNTIVIDSNNRVWFGSLEGITTLNFRTLEWQQPPLRTNGPTGNDYTALEVDPYGNLWVGTSDGFGISRRDAITGNWQTFGYFTEELVDDIILDLNAASNGDLWIGTSNGISHYSAATQAWESFTKGNTNGGLFHEFVMTLTVDQNGTVWFGTADGVGSYTPSTNEWQQIIDPNGSFDVYGDPAPEYRVSSVIVDANNDIWFGNVSGSGLNRYRPSTGEWFRPVGLAIVTDIAIDEEGRIWYTTDGFGAIQYSPSTGAIYTHTVASTMGGLTEDSLGTVTVDANGDLWFGAYNGLTRHTPGTDLWQRVWYDPDITADMGAAPQLILDHENQLWVGVPGNSLAVDEVPLKQPDLAVQITGPVALLQGAPDPVRYAITITNTGGRNSNASLTLAVPGTVISASLPLSTTVPPQWNLGQLMAGGDAIQLMVDVTPDESIQPGSIMTATATATATTPEDFRGNNLAQATTLIADRYRTDVRVSLAGPPLLRQGEAETYVIWIDNIGGQAAANTTLRLTLPGPLSYQNATPPPVSQTSLTWALGTLPGIIDEESTLRQITLTLAVAEDAPANTNLIIHTNVWADGDLAGVDNQASAVTPTGLQNASTLFLTAPERLTVHFGAASILPRLYELSTLPQVRGTVVDVLRAPQVRNAYAAWDSDPGNAELANGVGTAIKQLIDKYTISYSNLRYLVFVGGDEIIPYYRVVDRNPTAWQEENYAAFVPPGTVQSALIDNLLLTDDFYADRTATVPDSTRWQATAHPLYIPDFATGRLVETPAEILASIDAFLERDGVVELSTNIVGTDGLLTDDLGTAQCQLLQDASLSATCTSDSQIVQSEMLAGTAGGFWTSQHSNHLTLGDVEAAEIQGLAGNLFFADNLLVTIGCHAGLNVPEAPMSALPNLDLIQSFLGQGGTAVGSTAYAYATRLGLSYSEKLALNLTRQLVNQDADSLGAALVRAKQNYFAERAGWFDHLDEKVLLPVTIYGLPMLKVQIPNAARMAATLTPQRVSATVQQPAVTAPISYISVIYTFPSDGIFTLTAQTGRHGNYYAYQDQVIAQEFMPVQPAYQELLPTEVDGRQLRGIVLHAATYHDEPGFDPVITQPWISGAQPSERAAEPQVLLQEWDRPWPYALGHFDGLDGAMDSVDAASLNFVLGAYHGENGVERLYERFTLSVLYGDGTAGSAPQVATVESCRFNQDLTLTAQVTDDADVEQVLGVCDDGQGQWQGISLSPSAADNWTGQCNGSVERFYLQAIDTVGNVATTGWFTPTANNICQMPMPSITQALFLPLIRR